MAGISLLREDWLYLTRIVHLVGSENLGPGETEQQRQHLANSRQDVPGCCSMSINCHQGTPKSELALLAVKITQQIAYLTTEQNTSVMVNVMLSRNCMIVAPALAFRLRTDQRHSIGLNFAAGHRAETADEC